MADYQITDLSEITTPDDDDLLYVVTSPGTTPVDNKIKWIHVKNMAGASARVLLDDGVDKELLWWESNAPAEWDFAYTYLRPVTDLITPSVNGDDTISLQWTNPGLSGETDNIEHHVQIQYTLNDTGDFFMYNTTDVLVVPGLIGEVIVDTPFIDLGSIGSWRARTTDEFETTHSEWTQI